MHSYGEIPKGTPKYPERSIPQASPFTQMIQEFRNINCWERGRFSMFQGYENSLTEGSCLQDQTMQMSGEFGGANRYKL